MNDCNLILLPLEGPINLDRTVDEAIMENPDSEIIIAALDEDFNPSDLNTNAKTSMKKKCVRKMMNIPKSSILPGRIKALKTNGKGKKINLRVQKSKRINSENFLRRQTGFWKKQKQVQNKQSTSRNRSKGPISNEKGKKKKSPREMVKKTSLKTKKMKKSLASSDGFDKSTAAKKVTKKSLNQGHIVKVFSQAKNALKSYCLKGKKGKAMNPEISNGSTFSLDTNWECPSTERSTYSVSQEPEDVTDTSVLYVTDRSDSYGDVSENMTYTAVPSCSYHSISLRSEEQLNTTNESYIKQTFNPTLYSYPASPSNFKDLFDCLEYEDPSQPVFKQRWYTMPDDEQHPR